jgi:hypothetical protein
MRIRKLKLWLAKEPINAFLCSCINDLYIQSKNFCHVEEEQGAMERIFCAWRLLHLPHLNAGWGRIRVGSRRRFQSLSFAILSVFGFEHPNRTNKRTGNE